VYIILDKYSRGGMWVSIVERKSQLITKEGTLRAFLLFLLCVVVCLAVSDPISADCGKHKGHTKTCTAPGCEVTISWTTCGIGNDSCRDFAKQVVCCSVSENAADSAGECLMEGFERASKSDNASFGRVPRVRLVYLPTCVGAYQAWLIETRSSTK
jgi:hypothetical protein